MMKRIVWILVLLMGFAVPYGAAQQRCSQTANVSAAAGTTALVTAVAGATVRVCAFVLGSPAINSFQFLSNGQAVSGAMMVPAGGSISFGNGDAIAILGSTSQNLQLSVQVNGVFGVVLYQQD